jgi:acyl-CoA reductase-like NAD-dependent aldehyde dehydrogenase
VKTIIKNFIDGQWVDSIAGETFERINPADTSEVVAVVSRADRPDVDRAVDAAKAAYGG